MATVIWTGAVSDDVSVAGNYSGGAPGAGDTVLAGAATRGMLSGTLPAITSWYVTSDYTFGIGTEAAPLAMGALTGTFSYAGRGAVVAMNSSGTVARAEFDMYTGNKVYLTGGTWTTTTGAGPGTINVGAAAMTNIKSSGTKWIIATSATAMTLVTGDGHFEVASRNATRLNLAAAGTYIATGTTTGTGASTGAVATGEIAGRYFKRTQATDTALEVLNGGLFTVEGNQNETLATATITTLTQHRLARVVEAAPGYQAVITNRFYVGKRSGALATSGSGGSLGG